MTDTNYTQSQEAPIDSPPETVVSLVPGLTESMFDLKLGDKLVARTDYCIYPEGSVQQLPSIGGTKNPDVDRIIALKPGLVLANQEENRRDDVAALQEAGIPVWITFPKSIQDVFNLLWNIMYLFDETTMVARIRLIEQVYDRVRTISETREVENPLRVFVPIWFDPLMTFNADTYVHDVIYTCGGMNVFAERERQFPLAADIGEAEPLPDDDPRVMGRDRRYPRITMAEVEAAQPDVILLPSEPFAFTEAHVSQFSALDVPAAKHNRIHLVDGTLLTWQGTRVAYALNDLPSLLTPGD